MRCVVLILPTILVILCSFCVSGILLNGTGMRKPKPMSMPVLKIKIVEKDKSPPKVSAKIIGKGEPMPKIMARIYHGPKAKQMFRRKFQTQKINQQPFYYRKFPPIKSVNHLTSNLGVLNAQVTSAQRVSQPYFRSVPSYPMKLHFTSSNDFESNHLSDNSITLPVSPKGYLPLNNPQAEYLKLLSDLNSNDNDFLSSNQNNIPKLTPYIPNPIPVHNYNEESIPVHFHSQSVAPDKIQPNLSEDAKRYIQFMASGDYFLPKTYPDYRKLSTPQNYYTSQPKYIEKQPPRYIPLSQGTGELSRSQSPEKIEFTEEDAIHSSHYDGTSKKDQEIDIRGKFVGNSLFGRKKEYDTRGSENFLSEGVVREPAQDFTRIAEVDESGKNNENNDIIRVPGYSVTEFCDKKCSDNDYGDNIDLLCGTDRVTYFSEAQLLCIVSCTNTDIDIDYKGPCIQERQ